MKTNKDKILKIRVTEEFYKKIETKSKIQGISKSELIREILRLKI